MHQPTLDRERLLALARTHGVELTAEQVDRLLNAAASSELSDCELETLASGKIDAPYWGPGWGGYGPAYGWGPGYGGGGISIGGPFAGLSIRW